MRYVVRRVNPWSAAKVGVLVGIAHGLAAGVIFMSVNAALAPFLEYLGESVSPVGWPVILLFGVFGGSASAVLFAVGALFYNLASWLGASLVLDLTPEEPTPTSPSAKKADQEAPRGEFLGGEAFQEKLLDES